MAVMVLPSTSHAVIESSQHLWRLLSGLERLVYLIHVLNNPIIKRDYRHFFPP